MFPIEVCKDKYTATLLRAHPDKIFVFGCNLAQKGKGGQAIIRDEANAYGVPTKRYPSKDDWAYFSDKEDERQAVLVSLRKIYVLAQSQTIVFPCAGIGTGLARMQEKSPKLFDEMSGILLKFFGFDNVNGEAKQ